jgi:hypothetical protein
VPSRRSTDPRRVHIRATDYQPGTVLFFIGDVFFLAAPVVGWMLFRDRAWRGALELAGALLAPVAAVVVFGAMTRSDYLLWLVTAMYPAMSVGMLLYLLVRWEVFDRVRRGPISGTAVASPSIPRSGSSK